MNIPVSQEIAGRTDGYEVERTEGRLLYLKGHPYPWKGYTTPEQMEAVNAVKRSLRHFFAKVREQAYDLLLPHLLPYEELSLVSRETYDIARKLTSERTALIVSHLIEYDQAYRLRLQDLATETSKEKLSTHPIREILRLTKLNKQREYRWISDRNAEFPHPIVHKKIRITAYLLIIFATLHPLKFRKAIQESNWENLQFDEGDRYWACFRTDYKFFGHSYKNRQEMLQSNIWSLRQYVHD